MGIHLKLEGTNGDAQQGLSPWCPHHADAHLGKLLEIILRTLELMMTIPDAQEAEYIQGCQEPGPHQKDFRESSIRRCQGARCSVTACFMSMSS